MDLLKRTIKETILHKDFSLINVLQPYVTVFNTYNYYNKRIYEITDHDSENYDTALKKIQKSDYNSDASIAIGTFYKNEKPLFEEQFLNEKQRY